MTKGSPARASFSLRRGIERYEREVGRFMALWRENAEQAQDCFGLTLIHSLKPEESAEMLESLGIQGRSAADHYNRGCMAAAQEDFARAISCFRQAAAADTSLHAAIFNLAVCYERTRQFGQAVSTWQTYLDTVKDKGKPEETKAIKDRIAELKKQ